MVILYTQPLHSTPLVCQFHFFVFFFNDPATTEIYTLSLHDALPICTKVTDPVAPLAPTARPRRRCHVDRSEEHTSELQSHLNLVCRLLLEKQKDYTQVKPTSSRPPAHNRGVETSPADTGG